MRQASVGIGLRQPHYRELLAAPPPLGFVEVHSENFFADGGAALGVLHAARAHWPVSLHGVGLALGSAVGLDAWHLGQLAALVRRIEPVRVSDHAAFARAPRHSGQGDSRARWPGPSISPVNSTRSGWPGTSCRSR